MEVRLSAPGAERTSLEELVAWAVARSPDGRSTPCCSSKGFRVRGLKLRAGRFLRRGRDLIARMLLLTAADRTFRHTTLAEAASGCYFGRMRTVVIGRLSALVLALTLVVGLAVHGVQAAHMGASVAAAALNTPMPDGCNGCDMDGMAAPACTGMVAVLPVLLVAEAVEVTPRHSVVSVRGVGLRDPPDPFPPKSSVLI